MTTGAPAHRFAIRHDRMLRPLFAALGTGPASSRVTVTAEGLHVVMGWAFRAHVAMAGIRTARRARIPLILGIGVHGWAGRWAVNGSRAGAVRIEIDPPCRARVCGFPVRLRTLWLSLVDPDGFLAAVHGSGTGSQASTGTGDLP